MPQVHRSSPRKPCLLGGAEAGVSMVSVLVAAAVLGIVILIGARFYSSTQQQLKSLEASTSADEVEQVLQGKIFQQMRSNACFDPAAVFASVPIGSTGSMKYTTSIAFDFKSGAVPATMTAAQKRCAKPRNPSAGNNQSRYFCLDFDAKAGAKNLLLKSRNSFAEVYIDTREMSTNAPIPCGTFNSGAKTPGATLYYTAYWTAEGVQGTIAKQKTSVFYIGR